MHIAALTYYYLPIINGVTLTISDWKRSADTHGVDYTVFTSQFGLSLERERSVSEFPAIPIYTKMGITLPVIPYVFLRNNMKHQHIDCIHVHHISMIGQLAIQLGSSLHIPVVFTYHTQYLTYARIYAPFIPYWILRFFVNKSIVRLMNRCQAVTVALPYLKKKLLSLGVITPISIVPIGTDTKKFSFGKRQDTRKALGISKKDVVLLGTGRMEKEKNWVFTLRVFRYLLRTHTNIKLVLVGNGVYISTLERLAKKMRIADHVIFAYGVHPMAMPDYYAAGDIYCSASVTETFGRVIIEAMAARLPVVAFATPANKDIIQDGITGIHVKKRTIRAFADAVSPLIKNSKKRTQIGAAAQIYVQNNFDSTTSWNSLEQVFRSVVSHG